ncbi:MAG TPA: hypothetical protein VH475_14540 [Tepidisphaeraceae bacterium]|jgi:hypothetical protein
MAVTFSLPWLLPNPSTAGDGARSRAAPVTTAAAPTRAGPGGPRQLASIYDAAAALDPNRTYVFVVPLAPDQVIRERMVGLEVFKRINGRWRSRIVYHTAGQRIGSGPFATSLTLGRPERADDDLRVPITDPMGQTTVRSMDIDRDDPTRKVLILLTGPGAPMWERKLFPEQ